MAMKREDRDTWVAALRSGEYQQGAWFLCANDRYCCLGVAYEALHGGDWFVKADEHNSPIRETESGDRHAWRPPGVFSDEAWTLMGMNDTGATFAEIADWIEANVEVTDD